jgi:23S rRNA pseudouridine1911/1915/1917 synthase
MIEDAQWIAEPQASGVRLDRFVVERVPTTTRALVAEAIAAGAVRVNGAAQPKSFPVQPGDRISATRIPERSDIAVRPDPDIGLDVVYEDPHLLALNKPAGVPVHPLHRAETATLANGLIARFPELGALVGDNPLFPAMVHRIDTDTSGLILAARTRESYASLRRLFNERRVVKTYLALVHGCVRGPLELRDRLVHDPKRRGRMRVDANLESQKREPRFLAESRVRPIAAGPRQTLVEVDIRTGITHQIRCQLAAAGFPIVGDRLYGRGDDRTASRHLLHALRASLPHPVTGDPLAIEAPPPSDLRAAAKQLVEWDIPNPV